MEKRRGALGAFFRGFDRLNDCLALLAGALIGVTTLIIIYEVVMRYLVRRPTTWVNDVSEMLLVYSTFLGSAYVLRKGGHIKVDLLVTPMRRRGQEAMGILQDLLSLVFCAVFTVISWNGFSDAFVSKETTSGGLFSVPLWPVYAVIPFGALLLCIQLVRQIVEHVSFLLGPEELVEDPQSTDALDRKGMAERVERVTG